MPLTLALDELASFKIIVAMIKATKTIDHEIVRSFCRRKKISIDELLDTTLQYGAIRRFIEPVNANKDVGEDDRLSRLQRVGLVDVDKSWESAGAPVTPSTED